MVKSRSGTTARFSLNFDTSGRRSRSDSESAAKELQAWSAHAIQHASSFTGLAIACIVARVAEDGHVNDEDKAEVQSLLERQQGAWNMALVMDTLIMSMLLPLLMFEQLAPPGPELLDDTTAEAMIWVSNALVAFAFFITCLHIALCSMLYLFTSYLTDTLDILWFFATFYRWITLINVALVPICLSIMAVAAIGNVLLYGLNRAFAVIGLCGLTLLFIVVLIFIGSRRMKARFRAGHRQRTAARTQRPSTPDLPPPPGGGADVPNSPVRTVAVAVNADV